MTWREKKKSIERKIGFIAFKIFFSVGQRVLFCSLNRTVFFAEFLGRFAYYVNFVHRPLAFKNISMAFPAIPLKEKKKITRHCFLFMARNILEYIHIIHCPATVQGIRVEGKENLDRVLEKGKGAIIVSAHLGSFPLVPFMFGNFGYKTAVLIRPMRDKNMGTYEKDFIVRSGVEPISVIPERQCVQKIIKLMKNNGVVVIEMDQNAAFGAVWVKFFGALAATVTGPVTLALRTKAALVPVYTYREGKGKHVIQILPEQELIMKEDYDETILVNTIQLTRIIEKWIKDHPDQWWWVHRRWKTQPTQEAKMRKFKIENA